MIVNASCFLPRARYDASVNNIFLGLGSNLGDRLTNLRRALEALAPQVLTGKKSSVYESEPMYVEQQPCFYNMVVQGTTTLTPLDLLRYVKNIEREMGRAEDSHNQPRVIDIDVLMHGDVIMSLPELTLPHPRMHERAFVLAPLNEVAPFHEHPISRKAVIDLLDELGGYEETVWPANVEI